MARSEGGLAAIVLVLVGVWALAAVFMLARTLVAAQQIDRRVAFATTRVQHINGDTNAIPLLRRTDDLSGRIKGAVQPLDDQLSVVVGNVKGIDGHVTTILSGARSIQGHVQDINGDVDAIRADATGISSVFTQVLGVSQSIRDRVAGINTRAGTVIDLVSAIRADTGQVLDQVGVTHGSPADATIYGHANSIDCSPLLVLFSTDCGG